VRGACLRGGEGLACYTVWGAAYSVGGSCEPRSCASLQAPAFPPLPNLPPKLSTQPNITSSLHQDPLFALTSPLPTHTFSSPLPQATAKLSAAEGSGSATERDALVAEALQGLLAVPQCVNLAEFVPRLAFLRQYKVRMGAHCRLY
jgi:hypothetical protein